MLNLLVDCLNEIPRQVDVGLIRLKLFKFDDIGSIGLLKNHVLKLRFNIAADRGYSTATTQLSLFDCLVNID